MKNFCEEHNTYFQSFFYNNTETSPKDVIVKYKNHIKVRKQKKKEEFTHLCLRLFLHMKI